MSDFREDVCAEVTGITPRAQPTRQRRSCQRSRCREPHSCPNGCIRWNAREGKTLRGFNFLRHRMSEAVSGVKRGAGLHETCHRFPLSPSESAQGGIGLSFTMAVLSGSHDRVDMARSQLHHAHRGQPACATSHASTPPCPAVVNEPRAVRDRRRGEGLALDDDGRARGRHAYRNSGSGGARSSGARGRARVKPTVGDTPTQRRCNRWWKVR